MQHGMGAPLPPHEPSGPSGWAPGARAHAQGAAHGAHPPVPPAPAHHPYPAPPGPPPGAPQGPSSGPQPGAPHSPRPAAPRGPQGPQPGTVQGPPPGTAPSPAPGALQGPPPGAPAGPAPGWTGAPVTGHVTMPPPVTGTGAATLAVLLIGPAGAGKTTVARHWAQRRRVPTAHISLDDVREWVCSGFADPQAGWNENSEAQYRLARRTCGFAARNFLANGISCILDDAVFPDWPVVGLGGWKRHVGPGLLPVVLLPGLDIVLERNAERSGNRRLADEEVAAIHGRMAGWYGSGLPIIDNSTYDVETTARVLDDVLARAISGPPAT
ncbi:AAA family ATPase [Streptomyces sp. NPDC085481]|uniref:AAA family ATPase n=1 Tax=Streptomyces sp. NPDC085481 TaxID=3365727 RepID=UPI0037D1352F